jgi:hypothetical protein
MALTENNKVLVLILQGKLKIIAEYFSEESSRQNFMLGLNVLVIDNVHLRCLLREQ